MNYPFLSQISAQAVQDYTKICRPTGDWVSYRHPDYPPTSSSLSEGRFNQSGTTAFYLASGIWVAQKEVPEHALRDLYKVSSHDIIYFDLFQFSFDRGFHEEFLKSKAEDGWGLCQATSLHLTANHGLSGILYSSHKAHINGMQGFNMVILPQKGSLVGDTFFIQ